MFLVYAEQNRLLVSVPALLKELGHALGDELGAVINNEGSVEVSLIRNAIRHLFALSVRLALRWSVPLNIDVNVHVDDLVRGEESVLDSLFERIRVNRWAKVMNVRDVFGLLGRRRHSDLRGGGEVVKDLAPRGVIVSASAVAFVDDDEVEESRRELTEQLLALFWPRDR